MDALNQVVKLVWSANKNRLCRIEKEEVIPAMTPLLYHSFEMELEGGRETEAFNPTARMRFSLIL